MEYIYNNKFYEPILDDNHPVYWNYLYVCDGKVIRSDIQGTVLDLKRDLRKHYKLEAKEIRSCDVHARIRSNEDKQ